jgi:hypothetical protein
VELLGVMGEVESRFGPFKDVVSVMQDRWRVNAKCTIGSKIILDAPDGTPRLRCSTGSLFQSVWR